MYIVYVIIFTECRTTVGGFSGTWLAAHYQPATPHSPHVISIRVHHYFVALPALISKPHDTSQYEMSLTRLLLRFIVPFNCSLIVKFPFSAWLRRVILKITTVFTCCSDAYWSAFCRYDLACVGILKYGFYLTHLPTISFN